MAMSNEKVIELFKAMKENYWNSYHYAKLANDPVLIERSRTQWTIMYTVVEVMIDPEYADKIAAIYLEKKEDN